MKGLWRCSRSLCACVCVCVCVCVCGGGACACLSAGRSEILFTTELRYFSLLQNIENSSKARPVKLTIHLHLRMRSRMSEVLPLLLLHVCMLCTVTTVPSFTLRPFNNLCSYMLMQVKKTPLQIHFICLGNKEIYSIFRMWSTISTSLSTKWRSFHNFIFFCSNNTHVLHKPCTTISIPTWFFTR
jgi:hypothetical protein